VKPGYEYSSICFSGNGKFISFVNALGKENNYLEYYGKKLENVGSFDSGTFLTADIIRRPANWNLDNRNVQIILAIHYLTENDNENRDKKAKRLNERHDHEIIKNEKSANKDVVLKPKFN